MLTVAEAAARLRGFRDGSLDAAEFVGSPILVVDTDLDGDPAELDVPPAFPAVVVAVARAVAPALSRRGPDVAITAFDTALAPWVTELEPEAAAARLVARVKASPGAAMTLVGVLRAGREADVEGGLLLESVAYSMLQSGPEFAEWKKGRPPPPDRRAVGPAVLVERAGDRLEITLNRPHVHNAYNRNMRDGLCEALAVAHADPGLSVLIKGAGPSFCSGGDLDEFGTFPDPVTSHRVRTARSPARLLAALAARTTVVVHGSCAGSGIELPSFAGRVVAHPGSRMWLPELGMGLIPGAGGTVSVARRVGAGRAAWMALSGEPVDAVTARNWGLVDELSGQGD